ncbi:STAS domain-containing protein [Amycolatopsis benzoatilytica]|uniref:STAS domain-containing protein n=1 Tax=Amycolatopsis benzoatilytica TaxID=346045 RepID=UPI0003789DFE|nr:STAS domain-containing protein [Amycolatopsis benzoatilytica]
MSELTDPVTDAPGALSIERADRPPAAVLVLRGDLDLGTAPQLTAAVAAVSGEPALLVLDLAGVEFLASAGLTALLAACREAPAGTEVRIVAAGRPTMRPIQLTGLEDALPLYQTLEEALSSK